MAACRRAGRQGGHCNQPLESALAEWAGKLALCSLLDALSMLLARPEPLFSSPTLSDPGSRGVTPHHPSQIHPLFHSRSRSHTRSHTLSHALSLCFSGLHPHDASLPSTSALFSGCALWPTMRCAAHSLSSLVSNVPPRALQHCSTTTRVCFTLHRQKLQVLWLRGEVPQNRGGIPNARRAHP